LYPNEKIIFYYLDNLPKGKYWDKIKDRLIIQKIEMSKKVFFYYFKNIKLKNKIIYKLLFENGGGIFVDKNVLFIKPIDDFLKYDFVKTSNYEIVCCCNKNMDFCCIKNIDICCSKNIDFHMHSENKLFQNIVIENFDEIIFQEITDYNFSNYFHIIYNSCIVCINSIHDFNFEDIFLKTTTYHLLIRYILTNHFFKKDYIIENKKLSLINNIDGIYWINLERSNERRKNMEKILGYFDGIKNIRINAIDGNIEKNICEKYFSLDSMEKKYPKYSNQEYAILLSHLNAIYAFVRSNDKIYNIGFICEDDVSLDFIDYWKIDLKTVIENAPKDWEIIMLGYFTLKLKRELYEKWDNEWSAISYLVNYNIKNKLDLLKKNEKWICCENDLMVSDNYIFSKCKTYVYKYPYFTFPKNNDSTLHTEHLDYHEIYKISNYIMLENIF
jgi:GR25 family glycosyltransferase involved in LPS biosynthesis